MVGEPTEVGWRGRSVLVTGGAGFIGQWLVRRLLAAGARVRVADDLSRGRRTNLTDENGRLLVDESDFLVCDLREAEACRRACHGVEVVFHLADIVGGIHWVFSHERLLFRDNLLINSNVFDSAERTGVGSLVYVGTACSFPQHLQVRGGRALKEEDAYPANPESAYGWSKLMGEYEALLLEQCSSVRVAVLRLHNVYGPGADYSPERSQVIPSLVRKALCHPHEQFVVWGSGNQARCFVYIDDVVDALLLAASKGLGQGVIQIGTEEETTIRDLAETVVHIVNPAIQITYDLKKPEGDAGRRANWSKAARVLGWQPAITVDEGLTRTVRWMQADLLAKGRER